MHVHKIAVATHINVSQHAKEKQSLTTFTPLVLKMQHTFNLFQWPKTSAKISQCLLVIYAARNQFSMNTIGILFQKYVYSSFSLRMVLNCVHIWSVDLFLVKDLATGRNLMKMQYFETWPCSKYSCLDY